MLRDAILMLNAFDGTEYKWASEKEKDADRPPLIKKKQLDHGACEEVRSVGMLSFPNSSSQSSMALMLPVAIATLVSAAP